MRNKEIVSSRLLFTAGVMALSFFVDSPIANAQPVYSNEIDSFKYPSGWHATPLPNAGVNIQERVSVDTEAINIQVYQAPQECYQYHLDMHNQQVAAFETNTGYRVEVPANYAYVANVGVYTTQLRSSNYYVYIATSCDPTAGALFRLLYSDSPAYTAAARQIFGSLRINSQKQTAGGREMARSNASADRAAGSEAGLCVGSASPGMNWSGEMFLPGGSNANISLTFGGNQTFAYSIARGAKAVLTVSGKFSMRRSGERAERWPAACLITFQPSEVKIRPQVDERVAMEERGLFNGSSQTFRIDKSYGAGETMILLNAAVGDPTSTSDMYFRRN
jgi:hypothetical protein